MQRKKIEKKQAVLNAAIQVFARHGYHNAKMAKIAELAGVSAGSLYLYYKNKADILIAIFEQLWDTLTAQFATLTARSDLTALEKLDGIIDLIFDAFSGNPDLVIVFVNEHPLFHQKHHDFSRDRQRADQPYFARFLEAAEALVCEAQRLGTFNPNIQPRAYLHFIFGGIRWVIFQWAQAPGHGDLARIRQDIKLLTRQGTRGGKKPAEA
ncbi:TetR/AcrR family transcriptional regulator [Thermodesulfobacteriota bacterium]